MKKIEEEINECLEKVSTYVSTCTLVKRYLQHIYMYMYPIMHNCISIHIVAFEYTYMY